MPKIINTFCFDDGSVARIQEVKRKGKDKIILQSKKGTTWKTNQTLSKRNLPKVLENVKKKGGVKCSRR